MAAGTSFDEAIRVAARRSAVRVVAGPDTGSGFFARPGIVVTCAHVVESATQAIIEWDGDEYVAEVIDRFPAEASADLSDGLDPPSANWPFPDVAFLRLKDPPAHPLPFLSPSAPAEGERLLAYGVVDGVLQRGPQREGVLVTTTAASGDYQRIKDDQIVDGMSGSLVVSTTTGLVVGMIKASRDPRTALGGWITPSTVIADLLNEVVGVDSGDDHLRFDTDGWTDALLTPVRAMLRGQVKVTAELPYRLLEPPVPSLADLYVQQQTATEYGPISLTQMLAEHRHSLLIGAPGSGKTSLIQQVCSRSAQWWLDRAGPPPYAQVIPVRATASSFLTDRPFLDSVTASVERDLGPQMDAPLDAGLFQRNPIPGVPWLILIDGLDEVLDPEQRRTILGAIEQRIQAIDQAQRILVTTRPLLSHDLNTQTHIPRFELLPFDRPQMVLFARKWFSERRAVVGAVSDAEVDQIAERFVKQVDATDAKSLAGVPLLLTIAAIVFEQSPSAELPPTITTLYEQFVDLLLKRNGFTPPDLDPRSELGWIWTERIGLLEAVAYRWFFDSGRPIFDVALRLVLSRKSRAVTETPQLRGYLRAVLTQSGVVVVQADELQWIHLSIAEYLASRTLARKVDPQRWLWLADRPATENISRLALVQVARSRVLGPEFVGRLLSQRSAGSSLRELLGTAGLLPDELVAHLARRAARQGRLDLAPFAACPPAAAVLRQMAMSKASFGRRSAAATALIKDGPTADARAGVRALTALAADRRSRAHQLQALDMLVMAVGQRDDAAEFADDIQHAQRRGAEIVNGLSSLTARAGCAIDWPFALPEEIRRDILTNTIRSRKESGSIAMDAAYALANDFGDPAAIEVLEQTGQRLTRWRFVGSDERVGTRRRTRYFTVLVGLALMLLGAMTVVISADLGSTGQRSVRATFASLVELPNWLKLSAAVLPVFVITTAAFLRAFRPWWRRPTQAAESARSLLVELANNGTAQVQGQATAVVRRNRWDVRDDRPPPLMDWLARIHVEVQARELARGVMVGPDTERADSEDDPLTPLRQLMMNCNALDRRVAANAIYDVADGNPRGARPLLLLLRNEPRIGVRTRRKVNTMLDVLEADEWDVDYP